MKKKNLCRGAAFLVCLVLLVALLPQGSFKAYSPIDTGADVSLDVLYLENEQPVKGIPFKLYFVADVASNVVFTPTADFAGSGVKLNGLTEDDWKSVASTLESYANSNSATISPIATGTTDGDGKITFDEASMKPGLYLLVAPDKRVDTARYVTEPSVVCLPSPDETGAWEYDTLVKPKHSSVPVDPDVNIEVIKVWNDHGDPDRPANVTVDLYKNGEVDDTVVLDKDVNWKAAWEDLPNWDENDVDIVWTVAEREVSGYTMSLDKDIDKNGDVTFTVTNTPTPPAPGKTFIKVKKVWNDGHRANLETAKITVHLLRNGKEYDCVVVSAATDWHYSWLDLDECDASGKKYKWSVKENEIDGYTTGYSRDGNIITITNTLKYRDLPQTGVLWWPVPVLVAAGLLFLVIGLLSGRKD